jgi:hypothetical protein
MLPGSKATLVVLVVLCTGCSSHSHVRNPARNRRTIQPNVKSSERGSTRAYGRNAQVKISTASATMCVPPVVGTVVQRPEHRKPRKEPRDACTKPWSFRNGQGVSVQLLVKDICASRCWTQPTIANKQHRQADPLKIAPELRVPHFVKFHKVCLESSNYDSSSIICSCRAPGVSS